MAFFKQVSKSVSIKNKSKVINPDLLLQHEHPDIWFILDRYISKKEILSFSRFIKKYIDPNTTYNILYCLQVNLKESDLKTNVMETYSKNRIAFEEYIDTSKPSKIICFGRALYSITKTKDLQTKYFYSHLSGENSFFSKELNAKVWPVDGLTTWLYSDNFQKNFFKSQLKRALSTSKRSVKYKDANLVYVDDPNSFLKEHMDAKEVAWDTETSGFDFLNDRVGCITMSFDGVTGYYLPFDKINKRILNKFFENKFQILAHGKFDIKFLRHLGVSNTKVDFDTWNAGHLILEERSNSLKAHAWFYTPFGGYDKELDNFKKKNKINNYLDIPEPILFEYATMDAIVTFRAYKKMSKTIDKLDNNHKLTNGWSLKRYYYDVVIQGLEAIIEMERKGLHINIVQLRKQSLELDRMIVKAREKVYASLNITPQELNIDSPTKVGRFIENTLHWADLGEEHKAKGNYYLTGAPQLKKWVNLGYAPASDLLYYRELSTMMKTFIGREHEIRKDGGKGTGFWKYLKKHKDGSYRVHTTLAFMLAESGRNKSSNPNLQNQPSHGWKADFVKKIFCTPSKDYVFMSADYSGLQLRLAGITSKDPVMRRAFIHEGGDLHSRTAYEVILNKTYKGNSITFNDFMEYKEAENKEIKAYRQKAKCFVAGTQVLTNKGIINIEDFIPEVNPDGFTEYTGDIKVIDRFGNIKPIHSTYFGYTDELIEIELENGDRLEVTPDHRFPVIREGKEEVVYAKDLLETDEFITSPLLKNRRY